MHLKNLFGNNLLNLKISMNKETKFKVHEYFEEPLINFIYAIH